MNLNLSTFYLFYFYLFVAIQDQFVCSVFSFTTVMTITWGLVCYMLYFNRFIFNVCSATRKNWLLQAAQNVGFFYLIILRVINGVKETVEFFLSFKKKQSIPNKSKLIIKEQV